MLIKYGTLLYEVLIEVNIKPLGTLLILLFSTSLLSAAPFTDHGNGTVTDEKTHLMWQQQYDGTMRTWEEALTFCEGLSLATYADWRLPNIAELDSLLEVSASSTSINLIAFPNTVTSWYWSSTTAAGTIFSSIPVYVAWGVYLLNGYTVAAAQKTSFLPFLCVRSGL